MKIFTEIQNMPVQLTGENANLPLLAIEAANELDELIEGRKTSLDSVEQLAGTLKTSFRLDSNGPGRSFVDSGAVAVFAQAIDEICADKTVSTVEQLVRRAQEIVQGLESSAKGSPNQGLAEMRDFCIALANAATAYQQSIFEMRPLNPLRS